ncbi:MAG: zinc-dependent metalloprotease [Dermatophilaceae bacterium]|nr:zinc-dependent metalloprotease [Dermatophilaceae bacterium]
MSGDVPFGFGMSSNDPDQPGPDDAAGAGGPGGFGFGGLGGPAGPGGMGGAPGGAGGFDISSLGAALQQLGAMMQAGQAGGPSQGPVNWAMVTDVARKKLAAEGDPSVSDAQRRAVIEAIRLADVWLDPAVTFPAATSVPLAWSRSEWYEATLAVWRSVVEPIAEHMQSVVGQSLPGGGGELDIAALNENLPEQFRGMFPDGIPPEMAQMIGPMLGMVQQLGVAAFSMQLGEALAALAADVVSASDIGIPLTPQAQCALLPRNVEAFGDGLGLPVDDVRLYLALRESAHQRLFAHVSWLRPRVIGAVEEYARGVRVDESRLAEAMGEVDMSNPEALQQLMSSGLLHPVDTPEQEAAIARLETLLALVEGWVDDVVDTAIADRLPSAVQLRETIRRRRAAGGPAEKTFATLIGMELRPRLAREAATLFAVVRAGRGLESRDALWAHPDLLPGPDDLTDPLGFIEASASELTFGLDEEPGTE